VSVRNIDHDVVVRALTADGWTITDDPLTLTYGGKDLFVDLGAEKERIGAAKGDERIAIEIKSFLSPSMTYDLHVAVGQYIVYRVVLAEQDPDRVLYLAVSRTVFESVFIDRLGQLIIAKVPLRMVIFDAEKAELVQWIK
jgi:hypothetical protein